MAETIGTEYSSTLSDDIEELLAEPLVGKRPVIKDHYIYFPNRKLYICKLCRKEFMEQANKSTGNLHNHIKALHKAVYESISKGEGKRRKTVQLTLTQSSKKPDVLTEESFRKSLIKLIVCTDQAISIVDNPHFESFVELISKDKDTTTLPGRTKMTKNIEDAFKEEKEKLICQLDSLEAKVNLIIDGWTSTNQLAFQGVICRFINDSWELVTVPIDLTELSGSHTGENVANSLIPVLQDYKIVNKLLSVTTDNASNMDTFFQILTEKLETQGVQFDETNQRVRCLAHIINLCAKSIVDECEKTDGIKDAISNLRASVSAIRASPQRRETYFRHCDILNQDKLLVILDCRTRWNSMHAMITRACEMKEVLTATLKSRTELKDFVLSEREWVHLKDLKVLLDPLLQATMTISKEKTPNIASTTVIYQYLFDHFDSFKQPSKPDQTTRRRGHGNSTSASLDWKISASVAASEKLEKYYPDTDGKCYVIGTVLHPGFKLEWFKQAKWPTDWVKKCQALVTQEWTTYYKSPNPSVELTQEDVVSKEKADDFFSSLYKTQMSTCSKGSSSTDELKKFLAEGIVSIETLKMTGLLGWWKNHQTEYPCLSKMARDYLAVGGSGVPVESFFSTGTDVLTDNRQNLSAEHIKMLMLMKKWLVY